MIKKTTLFLLLGAIVLGAAVYYFDWKHAKDDKAAQSASKPVFSISASDVASFTISHPAKGGDIPIRFEKRSGVWQIVQPVETQADQATAQAIVDEVASAGSSESEPGTGDRRKAYGLDPPKVTLELQLQKGGKHTLLIGDKDFAGGSVYTIVDGGQNVLLLPDVVLTSADKPLNDLRDRAVLPIDQSQVASFTLKNSSGELAAAKEKDNWKFTKPEGAAASKDAIDALLGAVVNARMTTVVSEKPEDLAKYGLASPAVALTTVNDIGTKSTLLVGKKDGSEYFARDAARPMIFRIDGQVYAKLAETFGDLRDKKVTHFDADSIQRIEIHGSNGNIAMSGKKDQPDVWTFDAPDAQKGKPAANAKILNAIGDLVAEEVIDHPAGNLLSQVANPAVSVVLTNKDGKKFTLRISKASGDFVYAQTSDSASLFKLKKQSLDDLNFKPEDLFI